MHILLTIQSLNKKKGVKNNAFTHLSFYTGIVSKQTILSSHFLNKKTFALVLFIRRKKKNLVILTTSWLKVFKGRECVSHFVASVTLLCDCCNSPLFYATKLFMFFFIFLLFSSYQKHVRVFIL